MSQVNYRFMCESYMDWLRSINFFRQELDILKARVWRTDPATAETALRQQLDHYQHEFGARLQNLNNLQHSISGQLSIMEEQVWTPITSINGQSLPPAFTALKARFDVEEKAVNALRAEFTNFCACCYK